MEALSEHFAKSFCSTEPQSAPVQLWGKPVSHCLTLHGSFASFAPETGVIKNGATDLTCKREIFSKFRENFLSFSFAPLVHQCAYVVQKSECHKFWREWSSIWSRNEGSGCLPIIQSKYTACLESTTRISRTVHVGLFHKWITGDYKLKDVLFCIYNLRCMNSMRSWELFFRVFRIFQSSRTTSFAIYLHVHSQRSLYM